MGFLDKVKNMFTEEVEEEVKVEQIKSEPQKRESESVVSKRNFDEPAQRLRSFKEYEIEPEEKEVKKPVFFNDNDFADLIKEEKKSENLEPKKEKREAYSKYKEEPKIVENKHVFKPSPIISPVYGVLDKNYKKEDIVSKKEESYTKIEGKVTVDSVRHKAYGSLEDELENTLFGKNSIFFNNDEENKEEETPIFFEELERDAEETAEGYMSDYEEEQVDKQEEKIKELEDLTLNIGKELDDLLNKKGELENNKKKEQEEKNDDDDDLEDDLFDLIDSLYEGEDE